MNTVQMSWGAYSRAFGEAMMLLMQRREKRLVLERLEQACDALDDVLADLPLEGTYRDADTARSVAVSLREAIDAIAQEVSATRQ